MPRPTAPACGFHVHAAFFAFVNLMFLVLDLSVPGGPWFLWPLLGWGVVLAWHAASVYGVPMATWTRLMEEYERVHVVT
jgi:hypothetical protein